MRQWPLGQGHFPFTNHGVSIRAWSGHYIQDFLDGQSGQVDNKLMCGEVEIPLS